MAQYAAEKAIDLGARVLTTFDSGGTLGVEQGLNEEQLQAVFQWKTVRCGRLAVFAAERGLDFKADRRPWHVPVDGRRLMLRALSVACTRPGCAACLAPQLSRLCHPSSR